MLIGVLRHKKLNIDWRILTYSPERAWVLRMQHMQAQYQSFAPETDVMHWDCLLLWFCTRRRHVLAAVLFHESGCAQLNAIIVNYYISYHTINSSHITSSWVFERVELLHPLFVARCKLQSCYCIKSPKGQVNFCTKTFTLQITTAWKGSAVWDRGVGTQITEQTTALSLH